MSRHVLLVFTEPVAGAEAAYDEWYDGLHLDEVLEVEGVVAAERFDAVRVKGFPNPPRGHLAVYDVETEDVAGVLDRLVKAVETMNISPAIDIESVVIYPFASRGPKRARR